MKQRTPFTDITRALKGLVAFNLVCLGLMTAFRFVFLFYFADLADFAGMYGALLEALFLGVRFDLSVVAYLNAPVTLSGLIVAATGKQRLFRGWMRSLRYYYPVLYAVVFFILFVDFGFYTYFKSRINVVIFDFFKDDAAALVKTILQNPAFPAAVAALAAVVALVAFLARRFTSDAPGGPSRAGAKGPGRALVFALAAVLVVGNGLAARGSLRMFPLSPIYAEISSDPFINKLSLNGVFALGEAFRFRAENGADLDLVAKSGYADGIGRAVAEYSRGTPPGAAGVLEAFSRRTPVNPALAEARPNVVLIVMESFGSNLLRYHRPGFDLLGEFERHLEEDYVFRRFLPAGLITIHCIESLVLNLPQRPYSQSVTQSKYAYAEFPTAAALPYRREGYGTAFVYGGSLAWRRLDSFLPAQGFDEVIGEGAMPADAGKNQWGVYDEHLFDALYAALARDDGKPKFIMAMTTGNHPPYSVPADYRPYSLDVPDDLSRIMTSERALAMKRFTTYQYANDRLGRFISRVKESPLGRNTVIAVTGDHNFWDVFDYGPEDLFYRYSVPFYLYIPEALKPDVPVDTSVPGCHMDIMPTLYRLTLSDAPYIAMGGDLLEAGRDARGLNGEGLVISRTGAAFCSPEGGRPAYYRWDEARPGRLIPAETAAGLSDVGEWFRAAGALSDYIIKHAGAVREGKR